MDGVGMAWDVASYARVQQEGMTMAQIGVLNKFGGQGHMDNFGATIQSFKMIGCQWQHVEWMVWGWPRTIIRIMRCNRTGQHMPKLVYIHMVLILTIWIDQITFWLNCATFTTRLRMLKIPMALGPQNESSNS